METFLIFICIVLAFISMSFWEAYVEGSHPWAGRSKKDHGRLKITAYHRGVYAMVFFFLLVPLIIAEFNLRLFGVIVSASALGFIVEDFLWFIINPYFSLKDFNSKKVYWYPWIKIGKFEIPFLYVIGILIFVLSWYFLWR